MAAPIQNQRIQELVQARSGRQRVAELGAGPSFGTVLETTLKLSGHAQTRLQSRNIELGAKEWKRIMDGVNTAAQKGAKESLVLMDDVALVVSVKNKTVITAVDKDNLKNNVFTNIDSAVIV